MKHRMRNTAIALGMILGMASMALGQATSGETSIYNPGPTLPSIEGKFQYSLFASEVAQTGYSNGVTSTTNLGGSLEYASKSVSTPTDVLYSGAYLFTTQPGFGNSTFQGLTISQGLIRGNWALGISDTVSYLPNSPSTGLFGATGTGTIGTQPISGGAIPSQTVLTNYAQRVSNAVSGNVERSLDRLTSISGVGSYSILRFPGDSGAGASGEDSNQISGVVALNRRLDARNTLSGNADYQTYSFNGLYSSQPNLITRGLNVVYERLWTRALTTSVSLGPQWIAGYTLTPLQLQFYPPGTNPVVPGRILLAVSATASYTRGYTSGSLSYSRGVNGGSGSTARRNCGYCFGADPTQYRANWSAAADGTFARTLGITGGTPTETYNFGGQLTRRISLHVSAFVGDTVQHQSLGTSLVGSNVFSGTSNSATIGIRYSPRSTQLSQF